MSFEVKHVLQKDDWGCTLATIAMIIGKDYDWVKSEVLQRFHDSNIDFQRRGISYLDSYEFFIEAGLAWQIKYRVRYHNKRRSEWPPKPWAQVHFCEVRVGENSPGHSVVMLESGEVYDPLGGIKRLEDYYECGVVLGLFSIIN